MANENIKIVVQEVDETRPKGSGVSSDIVYVPGLAFDGCEHRNKPILCTTVEEFESYFGTEPYKFLQDKTVYTHNVYKGAFDRSYIYAKELLNAGLSVLYENISPQADDLVNLVSFTTDSKELNRVSGSRNVFSTPQTPSSTTTAKFIFSLQQLSSARRTTLFLDCVKNNTAAETHPVVELVSDSVQVVGSDKVKAKVIIGLVDSNKRSCSISWDSLSEYELASTQIEFSVNYTGSCDIILNLVDGLDIPVSSTASDRLDTFYSKILSCLNELEDKNEYTVKYITLGGYPSFVPVPQGGEDVGKFDYSIATAMLDCAAKRNDAVALIDHLDDPSSSLDLTEPDSIYYKANAYFQNAANTEFGAMFTPWGNYTCVTMNDPATSLQAMPASFGYLLCLAKAIKTSPNWLAMAGVTRGIVPNLQSLRTSRVLSNVIAENYQPKYGGFDGKNVISINAITNVKPYGLTIWGNRTLKKVDPKGTVATNFLNIRNMISDIKKLAYNTAKSLMFEQESDVLWLNFKSGVSPLLEQLKSGYGISDYKLIKNTTKYNGKALTRGEMAAVIKIFPMYAVEYFEITVVVSDNDVAVS